MDESVIISLFLRDIVMQSCYYSSVVLFHLCTSLETICHRFQVLDSERQFPDVIIHLGPVQLSPERVARVPLFRLSISTWIIQEVKHCFCK